MKIKNNEIAGAEKSSNQPALSTQKSVKFAKSP